jgi:hypothetical protein
MANDEVINDVVQRANCAATHRGDIESEAMEECCAIRRITLARGFVE